MEMPLVIEIPRVLEPLDQDPFLVGLCEPPPIALGPAASECALVDIPTIPPQEHPT